MLTLEEARAKHTQGLYPDIIVGESYEFYAEMQQDYDPPEQRMRNYTGQKVKVLSVNTDTDWFEPYEENGELVRPEVSKSFIVRAEDGFEFCAMEEELDGWDKDLGQYFWPDGTHGPDHSKRFLVNERNQ
jgi:hypothetical protein